MWVLYSHRHNLQYVTHYQLNFLRLIVECDIIVGFIRLGYG